VILIGLTGSIGMGKSTTLRLFEEEGAAVWDADAAVHRLYAPGGEAVEPVLLSFPEARSGEGGIDRDALSRVVLGDKEALHRLEGIVHPLVRRDQDAFLARAESEIAVLDIPLLAETARAERFDAVVVVTADEAARRRRVLARPGMSEAKLDAVLARQMPEAERLALADFTIRTDRGVEEARQEVRRIMLALREKNRLS
jgi:dephospho-CoA kinase